MDYLPDDRRYLGEKQVLKIISTDVCAMATSFRIACFLHFAPFIQPDSDRWHATCATCWFQTPRHRGVPKCQIAV